MCIFEIVKQGMFVPWSFSHFTKAGEKLGMFVPWSFSLVIKFYKG